MDILTNPKYIAAAVTLLSVAYVTIQQFRTKNKDKMGNACTTSASTTTTTTTTTSTSGKHDDNGVISPNEYRKFLLIKKEVLTSGQCPVKRFRFEIPDGRSLGLPVGQHISLRATMPNDDGELEEYRRSYTPTSSNDDLGFFELVVKIYPGGKMTNYLDSLEVGKDSIEVSGPKGTFVYTKNMYKRIGMICGGTGITPMLQVVTEILKHEDDKTDISMLFGNVTKEDIILHDMIDQLQAKHPNFRVYHVLNNPPEGWGQGVGYITEEMIKERLPPPSDDKSTQILLCGPPPMIKAMRGNLSKLGYKRHNYFTF